MVETAHNYLSDSALLRSSVTLTYKNVAGEHGTASTAEPHIELNAQSNGASLLELTAFEILLKALCHANDIVLRLAHNYAAIFSALPLALRERIGVAVALRLSRPTDDLDSWLQQFQKNFHRLRYPYEAYEGKTDAEVAERAVEWDISVAERTMGDDAAVLRDPSVLAGATFLYLPEELAALTHAIDHELAAWLATP